MRKLYYIALAIFLILGLYIIIMKTAPDKVPASCGLNYGSNFSFDPAAGEPGFFSLSFPGPAEGADVFGVLKALSNYGDDKGGLFRWFQELPPESATSPYLFVGTISGDLSYDEAESILAKVFTDLEAESIQRMRDQNLISWGGYSPKIPLLLKDLTGAPVNIQGALRYNSIEDLTYFYLGSPLIYIEY
ncbi:MAG: YwmB family TATA-box binding protein [Bacillota bacterium]